MTENSKDLLRLARPLPLLGQATSLAKSRDTLNEKGARLGAIDIGLDLVPVLGRIKGLFELFAGDVVTEQNIRRGITTIRGALDEIERTCLEESPDGDQPSQEEDDEERFYPEHSAKAAMLRAKAAVKTPYERRSFPGLA